MWLRLRKTARRGRTVVPLRRPRIRRRRRVRAALLSGRLNIVSLLLAALGAGLAGLASLSADDFALIFETLALVRLGLPGRADVGRELPDALFVDPLDGEACREPAVRR